MLNLPAPYDILEAAAAALARLLAAVRLDRLASDRGRPDKWATACRGLNPDRPPCCSRWGSEDLVPPSPDANL